MWLPVRGYEDSYYVSAMGQVARVVAQVNGCLEVKLIPTRIAGKGYPMTSLRGSPRTVHSLIAEAFLGPRLPKMEVNHKDGIKANSVLSNLEYTTRRGNALHGVALGLLRSGERHPYAKLSADDVREIRTKFGSVIDRKIAEEYGVTRKTITAIRWGKSWRGVQ